MCVSGHHDAVNVELKELLLAGTDGGGKGSRNNRRSQSLCGLGGFCAASNKELVVNFSRTEGLEGEARIAPKIRAFGRMPQDEGPQSALRDDWAEGVNPRGPSGRTVAR